MNKPQINWSEFDGAHHSGVGYSDMATSFGDVLVEVEENDYQGCTWILLRGKDDRFGYLVYSWGSCSGCDDLQGCSGNADLEELHTRLWDSIKWDAGLVEVLEVIRADVEEDAEDEWMRHRDDGKRFLEECKAWAASHDTGP